MAKDKAIRPTEGESRSKRPERVPVSGNRDILNVLNQDKAYVYRWVNDVDNRIEVFKAGYWEHLFGDIKVGEVGPESSTGASSVISRPVGAGRNAYLMRIKREWYEEDQANKSKAIKEQEIDMLNAGKSGEGRYGTVSIK